MKLVGIGTDLEEIKVFADHWESQNHSFFERVFTKQEIQYCQNKPNPPQHFAARFCAKEACVKAVASLCKAVITDFEIQKQQDQPLVVLTTQRHGKILDDCQFMVSLSHTKSVCSAFVVVMRKE